VYNSADPSKGFTASIASTAPTIQQRRGMPVAKDLRVPRLRWADLKISLRNTKIALL
jgi:hypothetical protein